MSKIDVAVIGAGPAGAWAAYRLARGGARVALIDPSHPREKPCGGGVTGRALALVADALDVAALAAVQVRAARFVDSVSGRSAVVPLRPERGRGALVVAARAGFDGALLAAARRAGAELLSVRVADVARQTAGFGITLADGTALTAGLVIGADGANGLVRRRMTAAFTRRQLSIAAGVFASGVTSDEIVIELVGDPPGYLWSFPRPDHLAVGICAAADSGVTSDTLRRRTLAWMEAAGLGRGARRTFYAWPIPSLTTLDFERLAIAGPGWCLVGDAAGLVDPITREGIFFALQSGEFAANAVLDGWGSFEAHYARRVRAEIVGELQRAARLKDRFFQPRFTRLMIDALVDSASIRGVMADLIAGTQSYRRLKWRLAGTFEIGYAIRAVGLM